MVRIFDLGVILQKIELNSLNFVIFISATRVLMCMRRGLKSRANLMRNLISDEEKHGQNVRNLISDDEKHSQNKRGAGLGSIDNCTFSDFVRYWITN